MHHANAEKSNRLKVLLAALKKAGKHGITSAALADRTGSVAIATDVSELRQNGHRIFCDYIYRTESGRKVYLYVLRESVR